MQGISRVLCSKGKWHGLTARDKPYCVLKDDISDPNLFIITLLVVIVISVVIITLLAVFKTRDQNREDSIYDDHKQDFLLK